MAFGIISTVVALAGIGLAYLTYITGTIVRRLASALPRPLRFLYDKWRFDELYDRMIVQPFSQLRRRSSGRWSMSASSTARSTASARHRRGQPAPAHVQTGLVANYALAIALGMVVHRRRLPGGCQQLFR